MNACSTCPLTKCRHKLTCLAHPSCPCMPAPHLPYSVRTDTHALHTTAAPEWQHSQNTKLTSSIFCACTQLRCFAHVLCAAHRAKTKQRNCLRVYVTKNSQLYHLKSRLDPPEHNISDGAGGSKPHNTKPPPIPKNSPRRSTTVLQQFQLCLEVRKIAHQIGTEWSFNSSCKPNTSNQSANHLELTSDASHK